MLSIDILPKVAYFACMTDCFVVLQGDPGEKGVVGDRGIPGAAVSRCYWQKSTNYSVVCKTFDLCVLFLNNSYRYEFLFVSFVFVL